MERKTNARLLIDPAIVERIGNANRTLWHAAHADGSDNRINAEEIMDVSSYSTSLGILDAIGQWIRKTFRNRNKSNDDLQAEKEAAKINTTCDALEVMLEDYLKAAQHGTIDEESLTELIDTLTLMQQYRQAGTISVAGKIELEQIRKSITEFTQAVTGKGMQKIKEQTDEFGAIKEQLLLQREWLQQTE